MNLSELVQNVIDGEESGLVALAALKEHKKYIEECIKEVEPVAMEEAEAYPEKSFQHKDLMIEKRAGGKIWNFKTVPAWVQAKAELTAIEEKAKAAYNANEKNLIAADQDGAEADMPSVTYRKDSLIIKRVEL